MTTGSVYYHEGTDSLKGFYPEINPYQQGFLPVDHGHQLYWEACGNPNGKPVIFLHGGPGGGCGENHRRLFNPDKYRIILFDQRGCGRSLPHASLEANTTWDLVNDIESLRKHLNISSWQVFGGSWGSTLALAYAETYPEHVTELILRGIFLVREKEIAWYYQDGACWMAPDRWEQFVAPIPEAERDDFLHAYRRILTGNDEALKLKAAQAWSRWEGSTIKFKYQPDVADGFEEPHHALAFARIENHYFVHRGFMMEGQLLTNVDRIQDIPGVIVQGQYDLATPCKSAWDLHRLWAKSDLHMVQNAGHAYDEPGILDQLIRATDFYAQ